METPIILRRDAPWCKVVVGGAVLTQEYADRIGADKFIEQLLSDDVLERKQAILDAQLHLVGGATC